MYDFDNPTYSNTTDNPLDEGYTTISADIYSDNISINGGGISMSYMPRPKEYDITGGVSSSSLSFTQGDSINPSYGSQISIPLTSLQSYRVISFDVPQLGPSPNTWVIIDQGYSPTEQSPFNVMDGGYLFKVTAELDTTSMAEFDANICKGNKDFKIMVDYNGRISQTTVGYVNDDFQRNMVTILAEARLVQYVKANDYPAFVDGVVATAIAALAV